MDGDTGHEHLTEQAKGDHPGEQANSETQWAQKLRHDHQQGQHRRNTRPGEERDRRCEPLASKPPEGLLRPVRKHDHREREPEQQAGNAAVCIEQPS